MHGEPEQGTALHGIGGVVTIVAEAAAGRTNDNTINFIIAQKIKKKF